MPQGLLAFMKPRATEVALPATSWPRLTLCMDQAADDVCIVQFAKRVLGLLIDDVWDFSHGANNDVWLAFSASGLKAEMLLWLLAFNSRFEPKNTDEHFYKGKGVLDRVLEDAKRAESVPIFCAYAPQMLQEPSGLAFQTEEDPRQALFEHFKEQNPWTTKGTKVMKARFCAFARVAEQACQDITQLACGSVIVAMELDCLKGKKLLNHMRMQARKHDDEPSLGTTNAKHETAEDKAIRVSKQNLLTLAAMVSNCAHRVMNLRIVVVVSRTTSQWQGAYSESTRDVQGSLKWQMDQVLGGFLHYISGIAQTLSSEEDLEYIGFQLPLGPSAQAEATEYGEFMREDPFAQRHAWLTFSLMGLRLKRTLFFIRGWPSRLIGLLGTPEEAEETLKLFLEDGERFDRLVANDNRHAGVKDIVDRSCFHSPVVQADRIAVAEENCQVTSNLMNYVVQNNLRLLGTQIAEDLFNTQKDLPKKANRNGSALSAWTTATLCFSLSLASW